MSYACTDARTSLLYDQEINPETYAVCKADMLLKGEAESAEHIVGGAEWSTPPCRSNPPILIGWERYRSIGK
jgi:type I restriction-modification system DNA methylase subunit